MGGDHRWRVRWFKLITVHFLSDALRHPRQQGSELGAQWLRENSAAYSVVN